VGLIRARGEWINQPANNCNVQLNTLIMNPAELFAYLDGVLRNKLRMSLMIWGPPGIGKSSIVQQVAAKHYLGFIDVRLSQLAPTDLRGMPVADHHDAVSRWYAPDFLPRKGGGVLFLDEINMATPALQGVAQQLILDRKVGNYLVPENWQIWAAGNRKEDRAAVYDMPAPVLNRFIHLRIDPELGSFLNYAEGQRIHPHVKNFLVQHPEMLHRYDPGSPAWPSPRSWMFADALHKAGLDISPAVGEAVAGLFNAIVHGTSAVPKLDQIVLGRGDTERFPSDPSVRNMTLSGLLTRSNNAHAAYFATTWLMRQATPEWVHSFTEHLFRRVRLNGNEEQFRAAIGGDAYAQAWIRDHREMLPAESMVLTLLA
jgi:ATPase family associated with various cellular activities (AAA)